MVRLPRLQRLRVETFRCRLHGVCLVCSRGIAKITQRAVLHAVVLFVVVDVAVVSAHVPRTTQYYNRCWCAKLPGCSVVRHVASGVPKHGRDYARRVLGASNARVAHVCLHHLVQREVQRVLLTKKPKWPQDFFLKVNEECGNGTILLVTKIKETWKIGSGCSTSWGCCRDNVC